AILRCAGRCGRRIGRRRDAAGARRPGSWFCLERRTMDGVADTKKKVRVEVVAQSEDGRGALDQIREHSPDVALIDYKLPELDGVSVVHAVARDGLQT